MKKYFVCIFFMLASTIFGQTSQLDHWKNKMLYVGGSWGLGPTTGPDGIILGGNLNPVQFDWQMTKFFALRTGLNFYFSPQIRHTAPKATEPDSGIIETYAGTEAHIVFPLLLKLTLRPGIFSFDAGGGFYASPVSMNTTIEHTNDNGYTIAEAYGKNLFSVDSANPFGFIVGGSAGVTVGQGILFLDVSYLSDFSEVTIKFNDENIGRHLWNTMAIDIGFKYGFFNFK